ncbi:MAG: methylated-DNA--[protein]-cysteine S-methyltransferase [Burkholderiales bacterium]|nr:methylated-DNA--[protein]-cysteine S-methyltransferase [Burkholderiales bacterium]
MNRKPNRGARPAHRTRPPGATSTVWCRHACPLGTLKIVADASGVTAITFDGQKHDVTPAPGWHEDARDPRLAETVRQLDRYFAGRASTFDLPLAARGTPFQHAVWRAIAEVPPGATITYAELARRAGRPAAVRAAAAATARNPWTIVVPCHRIVGADGSLTGYAGGLGRKRALLAHEGAGAGSAR